MATADTQHLMALRLDGRALLLGYRLGPDALLVLLDLAAHAVDSAGAVMVAASYRDVGRRVGLSKDTVGRRMAALRSIGVVVDQPDRSGGRFEVRNYALQLDGVGISLDLAAPGT